MDARGAYMDVFTACFKRPVVNLPVNRTARSDP